MARYVIVQLRTAALRRSGRSELVTYGPLDQAEPDAAVAAVADGAGRPWHRGRDGAWHRTASGAAEQGPGLPWRLLAFRYAPLTQIAEQ